MTREGCVEQTAAFMDHTSQRRSVFLTAAFAAPRQFCCFLSHCETLVAVLKISFAGFLYKKEAAICHLLRWKEAHYLGLSACFAFHL